MTIFINLRDRGNNDNKEAELAKSVGAVNRGELDDTTTIIDPSTLQCGETSPIQPSEADEQDPEDNEPE